MPLEARKSTPLHQAASKGDTRTLRDILRSATGCQLEVLDDKGWTPLHKACQNGHLEAVKFLIEAGANISGSMEQPVTPIQLATYVGKTNVVKYLLELQDDIAEYVKSRESRVLALAAKMSKNDILRFLLESGVDPNLDGDHGMTALHRAAKNGDTEAVDLLLRSGANVNAQDNAMAAAPLHEAVRENHLEVANLLLSNGAKVDSHVCGYFEPVHWAATCGHLSML